ncbi:MAG: glycosyltransferase family 4 protein [Spirulinaceae cyanobacterium]
MIYLFVHPNFPAQFRHLATTLAKDPNNQVFFLTNRKEGRIPGVRKLIYNPSREAKPETHHYLRSTENAILHGQAAYRRLMQLEKQGIQPDVIYAHAGWGPELFIKDLFPDSKFYGYFEWYYHAYGTDADFDINDPITPDDAARIRVKNAPILLDLASCDKGMVPTNWQKQQFPVEFQQKLSVLHDGIDTAFFRPKADANLVLPPSAKPKKTKGFDPNKQASDSELAPFAQIKQRLSQEGLDLSNATEIVTYVARGMEPYRGFPQFMEAVSLLQQNRPHCHVVVVGEDRVAYGKPLPNGLTYGQLMLQELNLDLSRLHFTGWLPYDQYLQVLQASSAHVYLTRPFVLSWSLLEAMAAECAIVASRTAPVEEVIEDGVNGLLFDFFSPSEIVARVEEVLDHPDRMATMRSQARETILARFDLAQLLPQHLAWVNA